MRIIILYILTSLLCLLTHHVIAQEIAVEKQQDSLINQKQLLELQTERERLINKEKSILKSQVSEIEEKLANNEITEEEAEEQKMYYATIAAENIANRNAIIDNQVALIKRGQSIDPAFNGFRLVFGSDAEGLFGLDFEPRGDTTSYKVRYDKRTSTNLVISAGLNNAIIDGTSLEDSPYEHWGSRYFEIGLAWKTRVFQNTNWLRVKYGFSFQFNGLKLEGDQYYVEQGDQTVIQMFSEPLEKSKMRFDNLVLPLHFEFGSSEKVVKDDRVRYHTARRFKVGLGGYGGFNITTIQKLKYEEEGRSRKDRFKQNYNTNNFIYGLSAYVGVGDFSIYAKYDLNTIFKNNPVEQRNASLGVRFDL